MAKKLSRDTGTLFLMCILFALLVTFIHWQLGNPLMAPSNYNSYTLQAMAWRAGRADLGKDYPHLELAIYQGKYFVSFPPVPSIPIYLLSFLFSDKVPDGLLIKIYAFAALMIIWQLLRRKGFSAYAAAFWAFMLCFASSLLPLIFSGAVWYQAQVLAFLFIVSAIDRMDRGEMTSALILFALAVGCRPFDAIYGPLMIYLFARQHSLEGESLKTVFRRLLPGLSAGFLIAAFYGLYNYYRFNNPFEFGHNYLPEFSFQGGIQFSLSHVGRNIAQYVFSLPFERVAEGWQLKPFGFSLFLANPVLLLMVFWFIADLYNKRMKSEKMLILLAAFCHLFFLLLHRTFGGYQYGARYAVDLIPYALIYLLRRDTKKLRISEALILLLGLALSIYGSLTIAVF